MSLTTPTLQIHIRMSTSIQTAMLVNCIFFFIHTKYRESLKFVVTVSRVSLQTLLGLKQNKSPRILTWTDVDC